MALEILILAWTGNKLPLFTVETLFFKSSTVKPANVVTSVK
jgi:hypothetical protein